MRTGRRKNVPVPPSLLPLLPLFATFLWVGEGVRGEGEVSRKVYRRGLIVAEVVPETGQWVSPLQNDPQDSFPFPLQSGWPVTINGAIDANPAVGDIDGDGDLEVVFPSFFQNIVGAFHHDGTPVEGWPQPYGGASAALVDLEDDGTLEVFFGSGSMMRGFFHDGTPIPGWPRSTIDGGFHAAPSVNDLDRDGDLELAAGANLGGQMHVWDESGEDHPGWPKDLPGPFLALISAGASSGNLDNDPELEIVVGSHRNELFAWNHDGTDLPGFPSFIGARLLGEAALADLDGDGEIEIAFGTDLDEIDRKGRVYVLRADGSLVPGWPQIVISNINGGVAVGDLNQDGTLEVVAATTNVGGQVHGKVWAWNGEDGTLLPGWPQIATYTGFDASPAIGDLSGDGKPDILAVGLDVTNFRDTIVWAWNTDGTVIEGFPFRVENFLNVFSSPTITDLDGDGDVEIGFGTEDPFDGDRPAKMYFFDLPAPYDPLTMEWPTLSHDFQRTGRYSPPRKIAISFEASSRQPFLSLQNPPALLIIEVSFPEQPTGPFAITDFGGLKIEPISEEPPEIPPQGRPGWKILRFDAREVARCIQDSKRDASEVELTLRAPIDDQKELVGEVLLPLR